MSQTTKGWNKKGQDLKTALQWIFGPANVASWAKGHSCVCGAKKVKKKKKKKEEENKRVCEIQIYLSICADKPAHREKEDAAASALQHCAAQIPILSCAGCAA